MSNIETSGSALATGSIASRFISQNAVDEANEIREKEWKAAYERIGQEPPPKMPEAPQDGRTLYERLKEQEELKQEMWDNRMKLSNQYRGLDNEEMAFLSDKLEQKRAVERQVQEEDNREVQGYREALAKKHADALAAAEPLAARTEAPAPKRVPPKQPKTDIKKLLKGVVVKKKPKSAGATPGDKGSGSPASGSGSGTGTPTTGTGTGTATGISSAIKPTSTTKRPIEEEPLIDKKRKL